jgi:hypothetical protein
VGNLSAIAKTFGKQITNKFKKKPERKPKELEDLEVLPAAATEEESISPMPQIDEEKVEIMIKESIMINPRDFSAFKHALEHFVSEWDI